MEENTKVDREVIEKDKEKNTLVVDEDSRIIDIETILQEKKDITIVNNINNLLTCGSNYASKEIIKERFSEKSGNLINEDIAMDILQEIFIELVNEINNNDQFVAVSRKNGTIDKVRSQEKLKENAEYVSSRQESVDSIINVFEKNDKDKENEKISIFKTPEHREKKRAEIEKDLEKIEISKEEIEERNNTEVTEEKVGTKLYKNFNDSLELLNKYSDDNIYSKDNQILIDYDTRLKEAKGTPRYEIIIEERNDFLKKRTDLEHLLDPETGMLKEEVYEANEEALKVAVTLGISIIRENGIENLDEEHREMAIRNILGGLDVEGIKKDVSQILTELIPGYINLEEISKEEREEIVNKEGKTLERINREKIEAALGIEIPLFEEGFEILKRICARNVVNELDLQKVRENNGRISKEDTDNWFEMNSEELNAEAIVRNTLTPEMKYFENSNIPFSEIDEQNIREAYKLTTVVTWINNKDKAILYKYAHLLKSKDELEKLESLSGMAIARLYRIEENIAKMQEEYPDIETRMLSLPSKNFEKYPEYKVMSKLSKEFMKDEDKVNSFDDYSKLTDQEKKIYLRNTIVALNLKPDNNKKKINEREYNAKDVLSKFGLRRLEVLNTSEKQFINKDGEINTEAIFEEYNKLSRHDFKNYKELSDFCEMNKLEYVNDKLEEYADLDDSYFRVLYRSNETRETVLERIEKEKARNWNKEFIGNLEDTIIGEVDYSKLEQLELPSELRIRIMELDKQIYDENKELMEFQRLQNEIEDTYGNAQKDAIKKRDELIRKNPDKRKEFLDFVENPVESNMKLEAYNNAIVEKNALLTIGIINSLPEEYLKYLTHSKDPKIKELKETAILTLAASLDGALEDQQPKLMTTIQKLCPNSKKIAKENGEIIGDIEALSSMIGKGLGFKDCNALTLQRIVYSAKNIMLQNENSKKIDNVEEKDMKEALSIESLSKLSDMFSKRKDINELIQNREEKYFKNSKYKYTENDAEEFGDLYCKALSGSWIEEKQTAEKYRYILLLSQNEERKNKSIWEKELREFEKNHPNFKREDFIENGILKEDVKKEFSQYVNMKYIGDIISDYVMDEDKVESPEDYQKLSKREKKTYFYNTVLGLLNENKNNPIISKLATRRLEIISTPEKNFMKEGGDFEIDKDAVFKEFRELYNLKGNKDIKFNSFEDFEKIYKNRKLTHVKSKLKIYDKYTNEDDFKKLISPDDKSRAKEIQKYKSNNALKRALGATELEYIKNKNENAKQVSEVSSEDTRNVRTEKNDNLVEKAQSKNDELSVSEKAISGNESSLGIRVENITVDSKASQEIVQDEKEESAEQPKLSFVDRIKNAISNFRKPLDENANELALVETKSGFLDNIKNAMKNIFGKNANNMEMKEANEQEETKTTNIFDERYKVDVDRSEVINNVNGNNASKDTAKGVEEEKDEAPLME